jgi:hypothetical protein
MTNTDENLAASAILVASERQFLAWSTPSYLRNGGKLEIAQQMANHQSARTTGLYDRRGDQVKLDEVERIAI